MRIILGIYRTSLYLLDTFPYLLKFPFGLPPQSNPINIIHQAIHKSSKIVFCLDGLKFPITHEIFTYRELFIIINEPQYLKKTQFYLNGSPIKREVVVKQLEEKNEGEFERTTHFIPDVVRKVSKKTEREISINKKNRIRNNRSAKNIKKQETQQKTSTQGKVVKMRSQIVDIAAEIQKIEQELAIVVPFSL